MSSSPNIPDLDRHQRRTCGFWTRQGITYEGLIDDRFLQSAFQVLDYFNQESALTLEGHPAQACVGACAIIRRALQQRLNEQAELFGQLTHFYASPNIHVAAAAVRALEHAEELSQLATPYLHRLAASPETVRTYKERLTLRGLAYIMLCKQDATVASRSTEFTSARQEAAEIYEHWSQACRSELKEKLLSDAACLRAS